MLSKLPPWETMLKRMVWAQLGDVRGKRILDFGSGLGISASHYADNNTVVAVEPDGELVRKRWMDSPYRQIVGSTEVLESFQEESFDIILCHSVLEYVQDREAAVKAFYRILKPDGMLSIVKHNPAGRVMQMTVLLNQFERAKNILDGNDDVSTEYGPIRYYEDREIEKWCSGFRVEKIYGICTFWRLQQNQDMQGDRAWQDKMLEMESAVSEIEAYQNIAFFHHLRIGKKK